MLQRFDKGKSVTVGADIASVQMKELLLSAFKCLRIERISTDKYKPDAPTSFLQTFAWLNEKTAGKVPLGPSPHVKTSPVGQVQASQGESGRVDATRVGSSSSEGEDEGPQPISAGNIRVPTAAALLQSAAGAEKTEGKSGKPKRHEWMTVLA